MMKARKVKSMHAMMKGSFSAFLEYVGKGTDTERNAIQPCNESLDNHDLIDLLMVRLAFTLLLASVHLLCIP